MKIGDPGFWIDSLDRRERRPALDGNRRADVVIVGAGYTGLWTAYYLKKSDPDLNVVVVERDYVGAGASGRNGGWVSGFFSGPSKLYERGGNGPGFKELQRIMFDTVDEIGRVVEAESIDADWVKGGNLGIATNGAHETRGRHTVEDFHAAGFTEEDIHFLEPAEVAERIRVTDCRGATFSPHVAKVHPAKLVTGLAEMVERIGVTIHEDTNVRSIERGRVVTDHGALEADWVVRATEGYTASIEGCKRELVPMNSSMIMSEPLGQDAWDQIGWDAFETIHDAANAYFYLQRTADGRIAIGGRGVPYRYGSPTRDVGGIATSTVEALRSRLNGLFPSTRGVEIAYGWSGILGVPRDWGISARIDRDSRFATAGGYVGEGVATANLSGRTLADLLLENDTELVEQSWVGRKAGKWEPEPLRFAAIKSVYGLYRWADRMEARSNRPSAVGKIVDKLSGRH